MQLCISFFFSYSIASASSSSYNASFFLRCTFLILFLLGTLAGLARYYIACHRAPSKLEVKVKFIKMYSFLEWNIYIYIYKVAICAVKRND